MNESGHDLWQELSALADAFGDLGRSMLSASRRLRNPGELPSPSLVEGVDGLRAAFDGLRVRTCRLAAGLGVEVPAEGDLSSLKALAGLLDEVSGAEQQRAERLTVTGRAVALLDRVLRLEHTHEPDFGPLVACQDRARALRELIASGTSEAVTAEAAGLAESDHPFAYLVALVEGVEAISDGLWESLFDAVGNAFGRPLSASVARARIVERDAPEPAEAEAPAGGLDTLTLVWGEGGPTRWSPGPGGADLYDAVLAPDDPFDPADPEAVSYLPERFAGLDRDRRTGCAPRRRSVPRVERLETVRLLATNVISGFVFTDANDDGLYQPGEVPIAADTVQLVNAAGAVVGTATTDANGAYAFTTDSTVSTTPRTSTQTVTVPVTLTNFSAPLSLAQFDPSLGTLTQVDVTVDGTLTSRISAENTSESSPAPIASVVSGALALTAPGGINLSAPLNNPGATFNAGTYDGATDYAGTSGHDFGAQTAAVSKSLSLTSAGGDDLSMFVGTGTLPASFGAQATSTASGGGNLMVLTSSTATATVTLTYHYTLSTSLQPGDYQIVQATEPPGTLNGLTSKNGGVLPFNGGPGPDTISVTIPAAPQGVTLPNNDFGELLPATVSGFVYADSDDNGLKGPGEPGITGVPLALSGANDLGQPVTATATTDAAGAYVFNALRPGTYTVTETTDPAGYLRGLATRGNVTPIPGSDVTEAIPGIAVAQGQTAPDNDFGKILPGTVSGFVYNDRNKDGLKEATEPGFARIPVTLTGVNDLKQTVSQAGVTGGDGSYAFNGLRPGTYAVSEPTAPKGFVNGLATKGNVTPIPGSNKTGVVPGIGLAPGADAPDNDFGKVAVASPGGTTTGGGPPVQTPAPQVLHVYRLGIHHQATSFVVQFSGALDPVTASNPANYQLVPISRAGKVFGRPIPIASAAYDATTHAVTLTPHPDHLNIHQHEQLTITGVKDPAGALIDGNADGQPGGAFVTVITKDNDPYPIPTTPKPNAARLARWARRYPRLAAQWSAMHTPGLPS